MNRMKIKTISMNERGVIVIPEEIREDMGFEGKTSLVLIERDSEIILKRESDVTNLIGTEEDTLWKKLSEESLKKAWDKKDVVWDKLIKKIK